jgi:hypothetical protein
MIQAFNVIAGQGVGTPPRSAVISGADYDGGWSR